MGTDLRVKRKTALVRTVALGLASAALISGCVGTQSSPSTPSSSARMTEPAVQTSATPSVESATPSPQPTGIGFKTPGALTDWKAFTWTQLPGESPLSTIDAYAGALQLISWSGGYALCGLKNGGDDSALWTSQDGENWTQITAMGHPSLVAAGPAGLVVIAGDQSAQTVWTSSNGTDWHAAGSPAGLPVVDSIAGTAAGFVASGHSVVGSGKFATSAFSVAFSSDGVHWTPVVVEAGLAWDEVGPAVQAGDGRCFLMGGYTSGSADGTNVLLASVKRPAGDTKGVLASSVTGRGGLWWSDDGHSWARSQFGGYYATQLQFGSAGLLLWSSSRAIPGGGPSLERSTDGGKTWTAEPTYTPLGATPTTNIGEGAGLTSADGVIGSNGSTFLAVKSNGQAWTSSDARNWASIPWVGLMPNSWAQPIWVLPRGVIVGNMYGAAG